MFESKYLYLEFRRWKICLRSTQTFQILCPGVCCKSNFSPTNLKIIIFIINFGNFIINDFFSWNKRVKKKNSRRGKCSRRRKISRLTIEEFFFQEDLRWNEIYGGENEAKSREKPHRCVCIWNKLRVPRDVRQPNATTASKMPKKYAISTRKL